MHYKAEDNAISVGDCTRNGPHFVVPMLDDLQAGHLRHIDNISRQPINDWRHMMGLLPMQEDYGAYRYQLAYMTYAAALAHFHRLPAAPALFKGTIERLIEKMLHPEVWLYWRNASTGGGPFSLDLPRRQSEVDPVAHDNIMYSAYVQSMALLYTMLFGDRRYERPGSLSFRFTPLLWGNDLQATYEYDQRKLNQIIYCHMVANGYLGVACEPYCVFQICNQIPILGFRLHDRLYGGSVAEEVTQGYLSAWREFGGSLNAEGHFSTLVVTENRKLIDPSAAWSDAWCGMLMNMWQPDLVRETYARARDRWLRAGPHGTMSVELFPHRPGSAYPAGLNGEMGWMAAWVSEMGDHDVLAALLAHADRYMNPKWENGGYFYPRNDSSHDADGHLSAVNPTTGNALLAYARLNVRDGLRLLFQSPWSSVQQAHPALTALSDDIDVRRAWFNESADLLQLHFRPRNGIRATAHFDVSNAWSRGNWKMTADGVTVAVGSGDAVNAGSVVAARREGNSLRVSLPVERACDIELIWSDRV